MNQVQQAKSRGRIRATLALTATTVLVLFAPAHPADASEVVKLTRLVLTGKRSVDANKTLPTPAPVERLPKVSIDGLRMDENPTQVAGQLRSGSRPS